MDGLSTAEAEMVAATPKDIFTGPLEGLKVIDADTHYSEPHDLWTSRVPASMKERVPHVIKDSEGKAAWLVNGDDILQKPAGAAAVIRKDGTKKSYWENTIAKSMPIEEVTVAAYDPKERLTVMDNMGIYAATVYANVAGFGANRFAKITDPELALLCVSIYNDAVAEFASQGDGRLYPMALVPFWDIDAAVKEVERAATELGLHGIIMCSEPHAMPGLPDLIHSHWNPLWEVCTAYKLPVNFHVGASDFGTDQFNKGTWPSNDFYRRRVTGNALMEMHNGRILANLLTSTLLDRYPELKWVLVESGISWIPYILERLEWQLLESEPDDPSLRLPSPTEQLHRHVYNCFWFEEIGPSRLLDRIGFDNVFFETDFPHPTCLYFGEDTSAVQRALKALEPWGPEVVRKVMSENAAKTYNIPI